MDKANKVAASFSRAFAELKEAGAIVEGDLVVDAGDDEPMVFTRVGS